MEAYFHNDSRIQEWIDQIREKVLEVCILTGVDSEEEFQRGCQIVTKVTSLLQGISTFPSEYLEDGLKQLLEQQIPDVRVLNNFPAFQDIMDRMIREGILKTTNSQNIEVLNTIISTIENSEEHLIEDHDQNTGSPEEELSEEFMSSSVIPALALVNITQSEIGEAIIEEEAINSKAYGILRTSQVPEYANLLKHVLRNIFPNSSVYWNMNLKGQNFLAQVENILICVLDIEHPCLAEDFTKEGWKVFMFSSEDLTFPRRLERGIRQIQRSGKVSKIV